MNNKFYIGPMSKNIVDAIINFTKFTNNKIGMIPSRRQIDFNGGYVNNWITKTFAEYVKEKSKNIILQRDHGGPNQGVYNDDGKESFKSDCECLDSIHVDPWKSGCDFDLGCKLTMEYIQYCYSINSHIKYEIGTEQSIFPYSTLQLEHLILFLKSNLLPPIYENIVFAVIQSGTSLKENMNTGEYDQSKLIDMVDVCKTHGIYSKEHNGDYLPIKLIYDKFKYGMDSINIAPEFGQIETQTYLNEIKQSKLFDIYFDICYKSNKWIKWVNKDFDPYKNKEKLINICGHYVLSDQSFITKIKSEIRQDIDTVIQSNILSALRKLYDFTY